MNTKEKTFANNTVLQVLLVRRYMEQFVMKARLFIRVVISYRNNDEKSFNVGLGSRTTISCIPFISLTSLCVSVLMYEFFNFTCYLRSYSLVRKPLSLIELNNFDVSTYCNGDELISARSLLKVAILHGHVPHDLPITSSRLLLDQVNKPVKCRLSF